MILPIERLSFAKKYETLDVDVHGVDPFGSQRTVLFWGWKIQ